MSTDAWLAIAHHLAIFGVFAVLVAEWTIVRPGIDAADVHRLGLVDAAYGALAALVLAAGVTRVVWGAKPADFYLENPVFWFTMAAFAAVGILSIRPTTRYLRWRKALDGDAGALPAAAEINSARPAIHHQLAAFTTIPRSPPSWRAASDSETDQRRN